MSAHWKYRATRCAVVGCERTRVKGWSTCALRGHYAAGRKLAGAGRIEPIELDKPTPPVLQCDSGHRTARFDCNDCVRLMASVAQAFNGPTTVAEHMQMQDDDARKD